MTCQVTVQQGAMRGRECVSYNGRKYYSFEGVPYAKPPLGDLRFRNPQDPEPWTGVRDATKPSNKCAQMDPYGSKPFQGSEDCLYLNIYTPSLPCEKIEKLPVIFFVHGGRFLVGHGDYYRPDYFIQNNVILVTINYRLHILGFLCLDLPEAPGNVGMKDTVMALKWIKNNIGNFNGDCSNVTVFGESAGAAVVTSYLTSKMADGLFHKVIAQSGSSISDLFMIEEDPIEKARSVASILGRDLTEKKDLYKFLIDTPIEDLVYASSVLELSRPPAVINAYFLPVVEKSFDGVQTFFEEYPIVALRENRFKKLPILTGLNSHEGALFLRKDEHGNIIIEENIENFIPRYMFVKENTRESSNIVAKLKKYYFNEDLNGNINAKYVDFVSDAYFNRDHITFVELLSRYHNEIYLYKFSYHGNMNTRVMKNLNLKGATHGDIIQYQFYKKNKDEKCTERDRKIINFLSQVWAAFAKNGQPTMSHQNTTWLPYTPENRCCLKIDDDIEFIKSTYTEGYTFWKSIMGERSKL